MNKQYSLIKRVQLSILARVGRIISDSLYLRLHYRIRMNRKLNLKNPRTFTEKLQWLKLYHKNPEYTKMVDKVTAKDYVASIIGREYIIPTLGVWNNFDEIDFSTLPNQFVLKTNHDSGGVIICTDKSTLDLPKAKAKISQSLKLPYWKQAREYPYKNVQRRVFAEEYMVDESGTELKDYKWFCFNGEPRMLFVASDRQSKTEETKFDFFDTEFNHLELRNGHPNSTKSISKPAGFELMKELAAKLSKGISHVRVDFYDINGKIYFGELTFFHFSGAVPFEPQSWDEKMGEWLVLPE